VAVAGIGLAVLSSACNPVTPYAAVVNGTALAQTDVQTEMQAIDANPAYRQSVIANIPIAGAAPGAYTTQFAAAVLTRQVVYALLAQDIAQRHIRITRADLSAATTDLTTGQYPNGEFAQFSKPYQQLLVNRQAEFMRMAALLGNVDISPAGIQAYIAGHPTEMTQACVSRIVVTTPAAAAQVEADLAAGQSFAAEAQAKSSDTQTSNSGGQLGCGPTPEFAQLGAPFEQAVATIPTNQPSPPVTGADGISIIEVTSRSPLPPAEAAAYARSLLTTGGQGALDTMLQKQAASASIDVDARYGTWSRSGSNGPSVTPPPAPHPHSDTGT